MCATESRASAVSAFWEAIWRGCAQPWPGFPSSQQSRETLVPGSLGPCRGTYPVYSWVSRQSPPSGCPGIVPPTEQAVCRVSQSHSSIPGVTVGVPVSPSAVEPEHGRHVVDSTSHRRLGSEVEVAAVGAGIHRQMRLSGSAPFCLAALSMTCAVSRLSNHYRHHSYCGVLTSYSSTALRQSVTLTHQLWRRLICNKRLARNTGGRGCKPGQLNRQAIRDGTGRLARAEPAEAAVAPGIT